MLRVCEQTTSLHPVQSVELTSFRSSVEATMEQITPSLLQTISSLHCEQPPGLSNPFERMQTPVLKSDA